MKTFLDFLNESNPPDGEYQSRATGNYSKFSIGESGFIAEFMNGVKGSNIQDTITIKGGVITSKVLGVALSVKQDTPK